MTEWSPWRELVAHTVPEPGLEHWPHLSSLSPELSTSTLSGMPKSHSTNATAVNEKGALVFSKALLGKMLNPRANLFPPSSSSSLLLQPIWWSFRADIFVPLSWELVGKEEAVVLPCRCALGAQAQPVSFRLRQTPTAHSIIKQQERPN